MSTWQPGPGWLFCPADRPDRFGKALDRADVVVLDLEDAVAPADRPAARAALVAADLDPDRTIVRVNGASTDDHADDLAAVAATPCRRVMLAKAERGADVEALAPLEVVALVETPLGVHAVDEVVRPGHVVALMWGADDLVAGLGGTASRLDDGRYRDVARHARSVCLVAAKAHDRLAVDSVFMDIPDHDGLAAECADAVASGFDAKVAIHPGQVPVIRRAWAPSQDQVAHARRVLAAAEGQRGVFALDGQMVDGPILAQARRVLHRYGATAG